MLILCCLVLLFLFSPHFGYCFSLNWLFISLPVGIIVFSSSFCTHFPQVKIFTVLQIIHCGIHGYFSIVISSEYMPRSGIAGSYGGFIPSFFKESPYLVFCLLFLQTSFTKHLVHGVLLAFKSILKYDLCNRKWFSTVDVFEMELKNLSEGRIKHL